MPTEMLAIAMLCLRFCISQMDSPTRNAYVQGVVHPDERSAANGVTNVVRSVGAASGPVLAGFLFMNKNTSNYPWIIAGVLKIIYDILLLYNMQAVKPDVEIEKVSKVESEEEDEEEEIEMQVGERWKEKEWERGVERASGGGEGGGGSESVVGVVVGVAAGEVVSDRAQSSLNRDLEGQ
jgi:MFS family permease